MSNIIDILLNNKSSDAELTHFYERYQLTHALNYSDIIEKSQLFAKNISERVESHREPILLSLDTGLFL